MAVPADSHYSNVPIVQELLLTLGAVLLLVGVGWLQADLDRKEDETFRQITDLAQLPKGEYLKPALIGYHHLGADTFWLRLLQVVGKKRNSDDEYEWIYHALDVITTLDPQYAYAYYVGGNILGDLARRPDLSSKLLKRGVEANNNIWYINFMLGYTYYFLLDDPLKGAEYTMRAASLPGRPAYLPGLATRMAAEAGNPNTAVAFLEARLQETHDPEMREVLAKRMNEVIIERDIQILERAVEMYRVTHQSLPARLTALVEDRILPGLPIEPFGGEYRFDARSGSVSSSTHPERLRTFFKRKAPPMYSFPKVGPSYSFPRTWE